MGVCQVWKRLPPALPEVPTPASSPVLQIFPTFKLVPALIYNSHIFPHSRRIDLKSSALCSLTSCDGPLIIGGSFPSCAIIPAPPAQRFVPSCYSRQLFPGTTQRPQGGHNDPSCSHLRLTFLNHNLNPNLNRSHQRRPTSSHHVAPSNQC